MEAKTKDKSAIIEKVKKLLNLADKSRNSSDAEAEAALLAAQKLMAEYDITIDETSDKQITYSTEKCEHKWDMGFRRPLANVIARNFRCVNWLEGRRIVFMGHATDARLAREAFEYAYSYIYKEGNRQYNKYYQMGKNTRGVFNSYALGFIAGLQQKLEEQSTALMIVTPPDVKEKFEEITKGWKNYRGRINNEVTNYAVYVEGYNDGKTIMNGKRLKA